MSVDSKPKATVMIVDDSLVMRQLLKQSLEQFYRVVATDNGTDALSILYQQSISIILLDISMPGIDGLDLCRTIRSLPQFQNLPIIMVTSRNSAFDEVQGQLAGATRYLTKPFNMQQLLEIMASVCEPVMLPSHH